jgi:hypothetical protein
MRLPSVVQSQRARGKHGVILQRGDSEIVVPGVSQPVGQFAFPFGLEGNRGTTVAGESSFGSYNALNVVGAGGAQTVQIAVFNRGTWKADIVAMFSQAAVTTNVGAHDYLALSPPGVTLANSIHFFKRSRFAGVVFLAQQLSFEWTFAEDGWVLNMNLDASVAGDSFELSAAVLANKLL